MKRVGKYFMDQSGVTDVADAVEKKLGINPIDYSGLTFKNRQTWTFLTTFWTGMLSDPYFSDRVLKIRKTFPDYQPDMSCFHPVMQKKEKDAIAFIQKMDEICEKATGVPFPDLLFDMTYPPIPGPLGDLLKGISDLNKVIPIEMIDAIYIALGLRFSQKSKTINEPSTLTKRDMTFLAHFLIYLHEHPQYKNIVDKAMEDEMALAYVMLLIIPDNPLYTLIWDEKLVDSCFAKVEKNFSLYEKSPEVVKQILDLPPE